MENNTEYANSVKTPRRTRRASATQMDPTSHHKRSTRKTIMPEIEDTENAPTDPVTPSRSARVLDFQTPSRSDALTAAQTPRRSVRKSIKPVQEYENIVAQKGLSAKRAASSSIEEEEEKGEAKWVPAVIGRVSNKRNKKAKRAKNKKLQRQQKIVEIELELEQRTGVSTTLSQNTLELCTDLSGTPDTNQLIDDNEKKANSEDFSNENPKDGDVALHADVKLHDKHVEDNQLSNEKLAVDEKRCDTENTNEHEKLPDKTVYEIKLENLNSKTNEEYSKEILISEVHKNDEADVEVSDSSMEEGDIEMATMPITADDCMDSPEKPFQLRSTEPLSNKNLSMVSTVDSVNKSNDSDCIMLESSQTEQSDSGLTNVKSIHDSCDSIENSMPPLLVCSDDEEDVVVEDPNEPGKTVDSLQVIANSKEETKPNEQLEEKLSPPESDQTTLHDGTFEVVDEPITENSEPMTPQTPMFRSSIARIPTPFKSDKTVDPDKVIDSEEEMDLEDIPEVILEPREIALKSSRKRSFSICADRPKKIVTFHSPANTTVSIYDGDLMKKSTSEEDSNNITQRRKRSLSVTETEKEVIAYLEEKENTEETPDKRRKLPQPRSRTKMPNFNAIHQQQFQRMESISDHVARKAERAKIISASKIKPASIQKGLPVKNSCLRDFNKDSAGNKTILPVVKARQRIELSGILPNPKIEVNKSFNIGMKVHSKSKPDLSTLDDFPSIGKISSKMNASSTSVFTASTRPLHLPKPKFDTTVNTLNAPLNPGKLVDRRKRMKDMYKARTEPRTGEKNKEILKGVRTNRRFELQMMCRNRPN